MTQQEAEGLIKILKRRKAEEVTLIEQKWECERRKLESDRKHTLNRLYERLDEAQKKLVNAKDECFKARGTDEWKEKKLEEKKVSSLVSEHHREISDMCRYYQNEFKALRDKRDEELRKQNILYSEECSRINEKVVRKDKEELVNYWKSKFYKATEDLKKVTEDLKKMKEIIAA